MNKRIGISLLCAAGAAGIACGAFGQSYTVDSETTYALLAPKPIVVFSNSSLRLPGRGGLQVKVDPNAALVEIRALKHGASATLPAPGYDSDKDPVILTTYIGAGIMEANPGRFVAIPDNKDLANYVPVGGNSSNYRGFFARVYNAHTAEDATYYVNSELVGYNPDFPYTNLTFSTAMKAIEGRSGDTDGDGISDEDEAAIGTNPYKEDTDGDGFTDFEELYFGFDPLSDSRPTIQALTTNREEPSINAVLPDNSEWHVEWHASTDPKVTYTLQFVDDVRTWSTSTNIGEILSITNITQTNWAQDVTRWMTNRSIGFVRLGMELDRSGLDEPTDSGETQEPAQNGE